MGIARTIERVKRQAKQGGLDAVRATLGEELRSAAIPASLRPVAHRLAALLAPLSSQGKPSAADAAHEPVYQVSYPPTSTTSRPPTPANENEDAYRADGANGFEESTASVASVQPSAHTPRNVTSAGNDSGAQPLEPLDEPPAETPVDAVAVGATPSVDATPVEASVLDATLIEAAPIDATPMIVDALERTKPAHTAKNANDHAVLPAAPAAASRTQAKSRGNGGGKHAKSAAKNAAQHPGKEKLADDGEAAKSVARSSSRGAKQRTGTKADTTSKKK